MKVSLITATFNSAVSVADTIDTVNRQTYKNIEHIFVDGLSSDDTINIINQYSQRDKQILSKNDRGIYDALNKGIDMAKGDIIGLVHSDDFLASDSIIADIVECFQNRSIDGVYGDLIYVDKVNGKKVIRYWKSRQYYKGLLNKGWMPPHPTLFLRRDLYARFGKFNLFYKIAADYDFILRIFTQNELRFFYLPKVICKMRMGGESNRSLTNIILKSREDLHALIANNLKRPRLILAAKNISKLPQFISKL